jgi:hypothetical protein
MASGVAAWWLVLALGYDLGFIPAFFLAVFAAIPLVYVAAMIEVDGPTPRMKTALGLVAVASVIEALSMENLVLGLFGTLFLLTPLLLVGVLFLVGRPGRRPG